MSDDYDKRQWQAEQAARDAAIDKQREKEKKARERSARNAKRKLERLQQKLKDSGELSDWEDEFSESVAERLDKYGSAFQDREKGRPGDALSFAQKRVVAALNAKAKGKTKSGFQNRGSGFKSKKKPGFTPRVRHIEDDMLDEETFNTDPPTHTSPRTSGTSQKPFLRLVKTDKKD